MCIGVPMKVISTAAGSAQCMVDSEQRSVSTLLIDEPVVEGTWLLVHHDTAIRTISAEEARLVRDALAAVLAAAEAQPFEHLIADLIDREPQLPPHLRAEPN